MTQFRSLTLAVHGRNNFCLGNLAHVRYDHLVPIRAGYPHSHGLLPEPRLVLPFEVVVVLSLGRLPCLAVNGNLQIGDGVVAIENLEGKANGGSKT